MISPTDERVEILWCADHALAVAAGNIQLWRVCPIVVQNGGVEYLKAVFKNCSVQIFSNDTEFIAADPVTGATVFKAGVNTGAAVDDQGVAHTVAQSIVGELQVVKVKGNNGQALNGQGVSGILEVALVGGPVGQMGGGISVSQLFINLDMDSVPEKVETVFDA